MKKNYKSLIIKLLLTVVAVGSFYLADSAQAGAKSDLLDQMNATGVKGWGSAVSTTNNLPFIIKTVISAFLGLLGIIFLILIIYAGFNWMTAQGDEDKVNTAKDTLTRAVIGLIIIIAAYSITYFVFSNLPAGEGGGAGTRGENLTPPI